MSWVQAWAVRSYGLNPDLAASWGYDFEQVIEPFQSLHLLICNLKVLTLCLAWIVRIHQNVFLAQACAETVSGWLLLWWLFWATDMVENLCFTVSSTETITQENTRVSHYPVFTSSTAYSSETRVDVSLHSSKMVNRQEVPNERC